jgi:3-oxoacyl-[acyl-carrier protein] reductase
MGRLDGKVAIVTGAARGIGAGIVERLREEGAEVVLGDSRAELCAATAARLGSVFQPCDVSLEADMAAIVALTLARFGRLDAFVQNAGIFPLNDVEKIPVEEWDRVLAINLRGCFLAAKHALPAMKAARRGRIVFTSSITGPRVVPPQHAHYAASKAGINGLIRAVALEAAPFGITVNGVEPGNILTEGVQSERSPAFIAEMERSIPLGRLGSPRDVANAVLFYVSDESAYVTGTTIVVDGGQILPEGRG